MISLDRRATLATLGAFVAALLGWLVAGWLASRAGLGDLDWPARVCGVFGALSLYEATLPQLGRHR